MKETLFSAPVGCNRGPFLVVVRMMDVGWVFFFLFFRLQVGNG